MKAHLQFVTTPTVDTSGTAVLLHFDDKRYLFGRVAEGLQRATIEEGISLRKVTDLFITGRADWDSTGGLIGMLLTLADVYSTRAKQLEEKGLKKPANAGSDEAEGLRVHGPRNLLHGIAAARRFVFRKSAPIWIDEVGDVVPKRDDKGKFHPTWEDGNIKVWAMLITSNEPTSESERDQIRQFNSRKRTYDEANGIRIFPAETEEEREKRYHAVRQGIVHEMFNSDWRRDALFETSLRDLKPSVNVWIRDPVTKDLKEYKGPVPPEPLPDPNLKVLVRKPWPAAVIPSTPPTRPRHEALSYIVGTYPIRGKFLPQKAKELGIPPGPLFSRLTKGESVEAADGSTVTPEMVMEPERFGEGFAVIDLPNTGYVKSLVDRPEWQSEEVMRGLKTFLWILGPGVAADPELKSFMSQTSHLQHIFATPDHCPNNITMEAVAVISKQLAAIHNDAFRIPLGDNTVPQRTLKNGDRSFESFNGFKAAEKEHLIQIRPEFAIQDRLAASKKSDSVSNEVATLALQAKEENERNLDQIREWQSSIPFADAEITTLGTGSALPSKYRNVSANLLRVPGHGSYILDCGENTLGQLQRVYTPEELLEIFKDLRMIWISHLHADHHLGTIAVVKAWYEAVHGKNPTASPMTDMSFDHYRIAEHIGIHRQVERAPYLAVVAGVGMHQFLEEYSHGDDFGYNYVIPLLPRPANSNSNWKKAGANTELLYWSPTPGKAWPVVPKGLYGAFIGVADLQAVLVQHCSGAMAVAISFTPDQKRRVFKVAYSGDCRPSADFAVIGQDATVLIHEATFEDELKGEAMAKMHSTTGEALQVAEAMKARTVVLTHFSQRYQKIPVMHRSSNLQQEDVLAALEQTAGQHIVGEENPELGYEEDVQAPITEDGPVVKSIAQPDPAKPSDRITPDPKEVAVNVVGSDMKVCVAFDYMRISVGDIARMEALTPALVELFGGDGKEKNGDKAPEDMDSEIETPKKAGKQNKKQQKKGGESNGAIPDKNQAKNDKGA